MVENQNTPDIWRQEHQQTPSGTVPAVALLSKKEIFYMLKPECREYRATVVRDFFTPERMERCQIDPEEYPAIRQFNFDQSTAIRRELQHLNR